MADILINFELPWNPAKKNQRIGRIDRLGQKSSHLSIFNFVSNNSIEVRIAQGLLVKQSLFDGVLNDGSYTDFVDFSEKGRSQFLKQIAEMVEEIHALPSEEVVDDEVTTDQFSEDEINAPDTGIEEVDVTSLNHATSPVSEDNRKTSVNTEKARQIEQVMNNGMQFLSGLFEMATGNKVDLKDQKMEINPETGEVTMKFKMPF